MFSIRLDLSPGTFIQGDSLDTETLLSSSNESWNSFQSIQYQTILQPLGSAMKDCSRQAIKPPDRLSLIFTSSRFPPWSIVRKILDNFTPSQIFLLVDPQLRFSKYRMSHSPADLIIINREVVRGHDNQLFEVPSLILEGPDAPARFTSGPMFREGTEARTNFNKAHEVSVAVVFKIYTNSANTVAPMPPNVTNGRRMTTTKAKVVDSKTFNSGDPIEMKMCLYGKSLNDLKKICADLCEQYAPMIQHLLLTSKLAPDLIWKGVVGRTKVVLAGHQGWFEFVELIDKYKTKKGSIMILNVNEDQLAKKSAEVSAAKQLIASAAGPEPGSQELEAAHTRIAAANKMVRLHETTARIYHHNAEQATGGDGVILTAPWDGTFHYRLTLRAASVWAQAVEDQVTTVFMAPDIPAYRAEMNKSRVFHRAMRVDQRVQQRMAMRRASRSSRSFFPKLPKSPTPAGGKSNCLVISDSESEGDVKAVLKKELPSVDNQIAKRTYKTAAQPKEEVKPIIPRFPYSPPNVISKGDKHLWTEEEPPISDSSDTSDGIEFTESHEAGLENFLYVCGVAPEDINTRMGLAEAGVESWSDLIPSVQMTEGHLVMQGIDRNVAGKLLARAQSRHWKMSQSPAI
ncbi:hypothetical protein DFH28DRAFT_1219018 [Melampsora americana]|nr:hypothetical protein DFH28DRAFT_1219018 [Melampsora americana]